MVSVACVCLMVTFVIGEFYRLFLQDEVRLNLQKKNKNCFTERYLILISLHCISVNMTTALKN